MESLRRLSGPVATALALAASVAAVSLKLSARTTFSAPARTGDHGARCDRAARIRAMAIDEALIGNYVARFGRISRDRMIEDGLLKPGAPPRGSMAISAASLTPEGQALLRQSKDLLFGLLFGDVASGVRLGRTERELLTLVVPRAKAGALAFMQASTELAGSGTWRDPADVANDARADNVIIEVEYGEVASEAVGNGILAALRVINLLEVNEQVLYARMTNVEQSSLVD